MVALSAVVVAMVESVAEMGRRQLLLLLQPSRSPLWPMWLLSLLLLMLLKRLHPHTQQHPQQHRSLQRT